MRNAHLFCQINVLLLLLLLLLKKKHSTELAVLELVLYQELDKGHTPINIFLDLSKAFDTLDHDIRLHKLSYYGIKNSALDLFKSYLSNRKQYADFLNKRSAYASLNVGVPQGSILGPLLFLIYVIDITASSNILKFLMYADDTSLFTTINCFENNENPKQYINDNNNNNIYIFYGAYILGGPSSEAQQNKIINQIQKPGTYSGHHQYEGPPTI